MKNKLLSILLCLIMVMPLVTSAAENATEPGFETKVMRGLFVIDSDFETNPQDELSRGDFVRILMEMIDAPEESKLTVSGFTDITTGSSYSKAVIHAANMGYISGYGDGTFRAGTPITPEEAAIMILKVAGYDTLVKSGAGSYLSIARSQNLLKGVKTAVSEPMTKEDAAVLLYNALTLEIYSLTSSTSEGSVTLTQNGELFMEALMNIRRYRDVVTSTYLTSLTGAARCVKGEITIGNSNFDSEFEKAEEYLGYRVEAYTRLEKNDETLVFAIPYKTNVDELKCEDITEDSTDTAIYYEAEGESRAKKFKVTADADKIVNGRADEYSTVTEIIASSDTIILIDNNDDNEADVVIAYAYDEMYVGSVSVENETIYSKYTFEGVLAKIELEDADEVIITKDGADLKLKDIKTDDVITVIETNTDNKRVVRIDVCDKKISGAVTSIDNEENSIYVDNKEFKLSDLYMEAADKNDVYAKKIEAGISAEFYLNSFGRISVAVIDNNLKRYGFLKKAFIDDSSMDMSVKFRILGTDGDWQVYEAENKIKINGNGGKSSAESIFKNSYFSNDNVSIIPQLVEFETNKDSKIKSISAAVEGETYLSDKFRYTPVDNQAYRNNNKSFDSKTYISGNTVTFSIPAFYLNEKGETKRFSEQELSAVADKYFIVKNGSVYRDGTLYSLKAYDCDKFGATDLIVRETVVDNVGELDASNFLFNRILYSVGSDDTEQIILEGLHETNISASAPVNSDVKVYDKEGKQKDLSFIERGDLLKLYLDVDNNVYRINVVYKSGTKEPSNYNGSLHAEEVYLYGTVTDIDPERGFVIIDDRQDGVGEVRTIKLYPDKISVYIYDSEGKKDNIKIGNINNIQKGDFILMKGRQSTFNYIVIYK